jgi:hypothetical protein
VLGCVTHQQFVLDLRSDDIHEAYRPVEGHAESCGRSHDVIESNDLEFFYQDASYCTLSINYNTGNMPRYIEDDLSDVVRKSSLTHCVTLKQSRKKKKKKKWGWLTGFVTRETSLLCLDVRHMSLLVLVCVLLR